MGGHGEPRTTLAALAAELAEISAALTAGRSGPPSPESVVAFAARAMLHSQHCGLSLRRGRRRWATMAETDGLVTAVDALQYAVGQGPCLDASTAEDVIRTDDLAEDPRWPEFGPRAVAEVGVRSMLSIRLPLAKDDVAALNFYAANERAFTSDDVAVAAIVGPFGALALEAHLHEKDVVDLDAALRSSRQIGIALGIIMARGGLTAEEAFQELKEASQNLNLKVRDLAAEVEYTGELPTRGDLW